MAPHKLKLGVLISGRGSNLQALIDATHEPDFPAEIALVLSNKKDAPGLARATQAGIPTHILSHTDFPDRESFDRAMDQHLKHAKVELVCLAGFMRLLSEWFNAEWHNRLVNIHPSLLPAFKGLHAQEQALKAGVALAGCTVHFVRPEMDSGPILVQTAVPVFSSDTVETLEARILTAEHQSYPLAIRLIASGKATIVQETVSGRDQRYLPASLSENTEK